ncbi:MAG: TMEM175 family protein [Lysobacteraceae bacterium]
MIDNDGPLRERGGEVTRLEAFVDAAFAFAVTLLVISLDAIPDSIDALILALKGVPAFAASFALIAWFWYLQSRWSRRYGLDDGATTWLSLLLVFLVLVYVYPLRMLFGGMFHWISGGWLPAGYSLRSTYDLRVMFVVYAVAWTTLGLVILSLHRHAWKLRDRLDLNFAERLELRSAIASLTLIPLSGLLSALAAMLMPASFGPAGMSVAGVCYWLMALTGIVGRQAEKRYAQSAGGADAGP